MWLQYSVLVCQWIVIVTLTIGHHDVGNSLLSPILLWIWDGRVFFAWGMNISQQYHLFEYNSIVHPILVAIVIFCLCRLPTTIFIDQFHDTFIL